MEYLTTNASMVSILTVSPTSEVISDWEEILQFSGATIATAGDYENGKVDFVTTDTRLPSKETRKLEQFGVPVLATEYVICCLIHQTAFDPYYHPKFYSW